MWGLRILCLLGLGCVLTGCAGAPVTPAADPGDPYEAVNRRIFAANQEMDRDFLLPTAKAYNAAVPAFGRERMHDLLANLDIPVTFANDILQGEVKRGGQTFARFAINSTIGLGGLFDPATRHFAIPDHSEDFGQTMAVWGIGGDPYVMLPVLGPSSPRDAAGVLAGVAMDPLTWISFKQHIWWLSGRQYFKVLDLRARNIDTIQDIERSSVDLYASTRSLYRQFRANEIRNGRLDVENLPDF